MTALYIYILYYILPYIQQNGDVSLENYRWRVLLWGGNCSLCVTEMKLAWPHSSLALLDEWGYTVRKLSQVYNFVFFFINKQM